MHERVPYKSILDNLHDGVYMVDRERRISYWNRGAERITGYEAAQVIGTRCADNLLNHVDANGKSLCTRGCPLAKTMVDGEVREAGVYLQHAEGHRLPVLIRVSPLRNNQGIITGAVETFSDNSSMMAVAQRVRRLEEAIMLDPLTGLGNRRFVEMRLASSLVETQHYQVPFGMLFIDIDHFKWVNDTHGHEAGDLVLKMVASTMSHSVRSSDHLGRWGGEEFIAIIINMSRMKLAKVANKLRLLVSRSRLLSAGATIRVTISIGATLSRAEDTPETILRRADQLLYKSKRGGRNRVSIST